MLPWAYWHYRVGAGLTGQLRYMKLFLEQTTNLLANIERGVYIGKPFDKNSTLFDGEEKYKKPFQAKPAVEKNSEDDALEPES